MTTRATLKPRLLGLLGAWFAMLIALYPAILLTDLGWTLTLFSLNPDSRESLLIGLVYMLGFGAVRAIPMAMAFSLLALPFLMLRRFVVDPRAPYLRPGYLAVVLYGPAIILLIERSWNAGDWQMVALYEAIALIATAIFLRLAGPLGILGADG